MGWRSPQARRARWGSTRAAADVAWAALSKSHCSRGNSRRFTVVVCQGRPYELIGCHAGLVERPASHSAADQDSQSTLARELASVELDPAITDDERPEAGEQSGRDAEIEREVPPHHGRS